MLRENIKNIRKTKGISQEELAERLHVVRQTVSKWEKGLSVPDSDLLIRLGEELETPVHVLLGETVAEEEKSELQAVSEKLERLNEQLARQSENRRKLWRAVFVVICLLAGAALLFKLAETVHFYTAFGDLQGTVSVIGGSDGPTNVFVSAVTLRPFGLLATVAVLAAGVFGLYKTRR